MENIIYISTIACLSISVFIAGYFFGKRAQGASIIKELNRLVRDGEKVRAEEKRIKRQLLKK